MERCTKDMRPDGTFPEGACAQPATEHVRVTEDGPEHPVCDAHAVEARGMLRMLAWARGERFRIEAEAP